ncbi:MAG TPA: hypothetical protein ENI08_02940 [Candidatus Dependentiae bacterium]|nr:hypothetical protein [Candidatus Dependentiae bacterium]
MKIKYELRKVISDGVSMPLDIFKTKQEAKQHMKIEHEAENGHYYITKITSDIVASIKTVY